MLFVLIFFAPIEQLYGIFHNCACGAISLLAQAENITCAKRKYNCAQAQYHRFFGGGWDTHTRIKYIKATYSIAELYGHNLLCREKIVKIVLKYDFCYDMIEK